MKLRARGEELDLSYPHIMGILNMTPDSFSDGGDYNRLTDAITRANEMVIAGATLIDIGGESTRPNAELVSVDEELCRVIPVVEALAQRFEVWISVDTSKPEVICEAARAGAHLINDVRALREPGALAAAAATGLPVCLMHMQGQPQSMQHNPTYQDLVQEVDEFLTAQIARCHAAGIAHDNLIIDPGFGFGKSLQHNFELLAKLNHFHHYNLPLLVGLSRKSMLGQLLNAGPTQRLNGSLAAAVIAAMQGAQIIRVHDVKQSVEAIRVVEATLRAKG